MAKIEKYGLDIFDTLTPEKVNYALDEKFPSSFPKVDIEPVLVKIEKIQELPVNIVEKVIIEKPVFVYKTPSERIKNHATGNQYVVVLKGETIIKLAEIYKKSTGTLLKNNDLSPNSKITTGQNIFFRPKKKYGYNKTYNVVEGDTMYLISQKAGIKLKKLYRRNRMKIGEKPTVNTVLYLQGKKDKK